MAIVDLEAAAGKTSHFGLRQKRWTKQSMRGTGRSHHGQDRGWLKRAAQSRRSLRILRGRSQVEQHDLAAFALPGQAFGVQRRERLIDVEGGLQFAHFGEQLGPELAQAQPESRHARRCPPVVDRFPDIDLALLHLGGTMFFGLLMVTMDPKQGVEVIRLVKPKTAIPIHYDDYSAFEFALGDTAPPTADPPEWWNRTKITSFEEFITMAKEAAPGTTVHILRRGETYTFEVPKSRR
jgi:hypothetical protein